MSKTENAITHPIYGLRDMLLTHPVTQGVEFILKYEGSLHKE